MSISQFATRLGITHTHASKLINGKIGVSTMIAYRLERLFGVSVDTRLNLQRDYDKWQTQQELDVSHIQPMKLPA